MYYKDIYCFDGVYLFLEDSQEDYLSLIVASEKEEMFSGSYRTFEIKNETTDIQVKGREWSVQSELSDLISWLFKRSFTKGNTKRDLKYFSDLLHLLQSNKLSRSSFGMLGEILFAYHTKLDKKILVDWISAKNISFDFQGEDKFYEVKTTNCLDSEVVLHLSYNQIRSLGNASVELLLVDMNGSKLEYSIEEITAYFESLDLPDDLLSKVRGCLQIFKDHNPFTFDIFSYSGPKLLLKLDDKIIGLKCKAKFDLENDFISFS